MAIVQTREATEDVVLGTHQIPAGTRIWINVLSLHLDDKYFPNAKVCLHVFVFACSGLQLYSACSCCPATLALSSSNDGLADENVWHGSDTSSVTFP